MHTRFTGSALFNSSRAAAKTVPYAGLSFIITGITITKTDADKGSPLIMDGGLAGSEYLVYKSHFKGNSQEHPLFPSNKQWKE